MNDVDVVVIGSGIAGLAAANSAWEHGLKRVLIAESEGGRWRFVTTLGWHCDGCANALSTSSRH
jgi:succinate dehydrogenase/fumarate reductase flavoprotein subunit